MKAESPMTSTDLAVAVHGTAKHVTLHVLLLEAGDLLTGKAASRLEGLSSAVKPANALEAVILVHEHTDTNMRLYSITQLQNMFVLRISLAHLTSIAGFSNTDGRYAFM